MHCMDVQIARRLALQIFVVKRKTISNAEKGIKNSFYELLWRSLHGGFSLNFKNLG